MDEQIKASGARLEHVATLDRHIATRSDFDRALLDLLALSPRSGADGKRDGRRAAMVTVLDNRATWNQIKDWRRNWRPAPRWAFELLARKMLDRRAVLDRGINATQSKTAGG